jgi:hypothetical protein
MKKLGLYFLMKRFVFAVFVFLTMVVIAPAQTSVRFTFANGQYNISQYTNVQVILQPEQLNSSGTVTIGTAKIYRTTDTNASVTFSNLAGSYTGGYYHWTVPAFTSPNGYNPPVTIQGDIQVVSTNLGLIDSTTIGVIFPPVYSGFGAAWTAQAADQRYSVSSNNLSSYVQIGQLTATSNSLAASIVGTTNGMTSIVYSNPSAFVTPNQATNIAQGAYNANPSNYATLPQVATTNLATLTTVTSLVTSATNGLLRATDAAVTYYGIGNPSNFVNQTALTLTNAALLAAIANTNAANLVITTNLVSNATNGLATSASVGVASNALTQAKQPSSAILTNLANTGAFTNSIAAGTNIVFVTNGSTIIISATASGGTTYTNNASGLPGVVLGSGIGTNLTSYALKTDATNAASVVYSNNAAGYIRTNDQLNAYNISDSSGQLAGLWNTNVVTVQNSNIGGINTDYTLSGAGYFYTSLAGGYIITNIPNGFTNSVASCATRCWVIASPSTFTPDFYQGFLTNIIPIGFWIPSFAPFHSGASSHFQNQGVTASNNNTNYVLVSDFAVDAVTFTNSFQPTNANLSAWALYGTNSKVASTDGRVVNAVTNVSQLTNVALFGQISFGTKTNFLITTNLVGIIGSGSPTVDGTYINTANGSTWTNPFDARMTILLSAPTYFLQSNSVSLYSSTNIVTWVVVNGANPVPVGAWGSVWHMNGTQLKGIVWSTNITAQILAAQSAFAATGSVAAATSAAFAGIASNSPLGTFGTAAIVDTNRFLLSGLGGNSDGNLLTNLNGSKLVNGTVSSNAFDAGTLARLYAVGGTNDAVLQISNNLLVRIVGGTLNTNTSANGSVIIGGSGNTAFGTYNSVILGGAVNGLGNTANHSTMLGGQYNTNLLADFATVVGGQYNLLMGDWSTILGGTNNQSLASYTSILGGNGGRAAHQGVTIIADSQSTSNRSFTNDMMLLRFANGVTINTNNPNGYALNVFGTINATNVLINGSAISGGSTAGAVTTNWFPARTFYVATNGNNSTAVVNDASHPYAPTWSLTNGVCSLATNGDTIMLLPGTNYFTVGGVGIPLRDGVTFRGVSRELVVINETNNTPNIYSTFQPRNNVTIKSLTWLYPSNTSYSSGFMFHGDNDGRSFTNVVVDDCKLIGGIDVFVSGEGIPAVRQVVVKNSLVTTHWDIISINSVINGSIVFINNDIYCTADSGPVHFNDNNTTFTDYGSRWYGFPAWTNQTIIVDSFATAKQFSLNGSQFYVTNMAQLFLTNYGNYTGEYVDMLAGKSYSLDADRSGYYTNLITTNQANSFVVTNFSQNLCTNFYITSYGSNTPEDLYYTNMIYPSDFSTGYGVWSNSSGYKIVLNDPTVVAGYGGNSARPILSLEKGNGTDLYDQTSQNPINTYNNGLAFDAVVNGTNAPPFITYGPNSWVTNYVNSYLPQMFNGAIKGSATGLLSLSTSLSNKLAPTAITFPATTVNWTNTQSFKIVVYIDNAGVTGTTIKKNGATISSTLMTTGMATIDLQSGDYFSETYTIGTPTAKWSPF